MIEFRKLHSPRFYLRVGPIAVMYWPRERWLRRIEFVRA